MVVLDLELNQPFGEIIEIGAVAVNLNTNSNSLEMLDIFQLLCKNTADISTEITELTGIDKEMLDSADSFQEVAIKFWNWFDKQQVGKNLAAWGEDYRLLVEQSRRNRIMNIPKFYPFNIKALANFHLRAKEGAKAKGGLRKTLDKLSPAYKYKEHEALEDARATAEVAYILFKNAQKYWQTVELLND